MTSAQQEAIPLSTGLSASAQLRPRKPAEWVVARLRAGVQQAQRLAQNVKARTQSKQLRLVETVQMGDKRFVSIIEADGKRFLIGGGATAVSMLAELGPTRKDIDDDFPETMLTLQRRDPSPAVGCAQVSRADP